MYHRGSKWTCRRGVCGCPHVGGISDAKGRGVLAKGLPVPGEQMMPSLVLQVVTEAQGC